MNPNKFLSKFAEVLERNNPLNPEDKLVNINELDSLGNLLLLSLVNEEYNLTMSRKDLKKMETIQDIIDFIETKMKHSCRQVGTKKNENDMCQISDHFQVK